MYYQFLTIHDLSHAKGRYLWPLRSFMRRHPIFIFCTSLVFVILASTFLAYDIVYLKAKLAIAGSYNAFLTHLWPVGLPNRTDVWENENSKAMHALISCMSADNCLENQSSIVLLSSFHFANSISGHVSGEDIWCVPRECTAVECSYRAYQGNERCRRIRFTLRHCR